jgi:rfaE bifunctional protein nucleotidyltransferase chain/domain
VFTNGCFDVIHVGHIRLLKFASNLGKKLIVGLNSDASVKRLKGEDRPIHSQDIREEVLRAIRYVDDVFIFDEDTPQRLIEEVSPDILVKGSDWTGNVVGTEYVESYGGKVVLIPLEKGFSSTNIIKKQGMVKKNKNIRL